MRSWLFVPASAPDKIEKAINSAADAVIIDLEDAVAASEKEAAREAVCAWAEGRGPDGKKRFLRVNERASQWYDEDMRMAVACRFDGVMLPKSNGGEDIQAAERTLRSAGASPESFELLPLVETACGVTHAGEIAGSGVFVKRMAFGSIDFLLDMGGRSTPSGLELLYARSQLALASRAAGKEGPVDAVFPNFRDDEALRQDAQLAQSIGFAGKMVIHPRQIQVVNEVFSPTAEEIAFARQVVGEFTAAVAAGLGAIRIGGKMVDKPVYEKNKRLLAAAEQYGLL